LFLKEFAIRRYGPLADSGKRLLGPFNLFYGPNEEGKTLTIDALLKILFARGTARFFEGVKRVDETPDGYLVIETADKREVKLPESGAFPEIFGLGLSEFGNIFVIRDSDLAISNEGNFYHEITARLTGMRSTEISRIKDQLYELGCITPGGEFQNVAPAKLKERLKKATLILKKSEELIIKLQEEGFNLFEEELAGLDQYHRESAEKLSQFRAAQGRERYEKGKEALRKMAEAMTALNDLEAYQQEDYEAWQRFEMSLEHLQNDYNNLNKEIAEKKVSLAAARKGRQNKAAAFRKIDRELKNALENIEPLLTEYDQQHIFYARQNALVKNRFFDRVAVTAVLVMLLSLAGSLVRPAWWFYLLFVVSAAFTVLSGWFRFRFLAKQGRLDELEAQICGRAEELGFAAGDIHAVRTGFGRLKSEASLAAESLSEAEKEVEWQQKELERLTERLDEKIRRISELEENLKRLSSELSIESREEFATLLKRKQELGNETDKQRSLLESHFERQSELSSDEARINFWTDRVNELSDYAHAAPNLKYDQSAVNWLNEEIEKSKNESRVLQEKIRERLEELRDLERDVNDLLYLDEEDYLPCQTALDLEMIRRKLQEWIAGREDRREAALIALEIFKELAVEEEQKISALFGRESPVSAYFEKITGGRYREVIFESRENPIIAICQDGLELGAGKLSGGTFDQLYFSIRLALADKLLEGEKGFFILDDPFIKADPGRLEVLMDMLFEACAAGWQILYFSSKGEVKDVLQDKIKAGEVREFSIGPQ